MELIRRLFGTTPPEPAAPPPSPKQRRKRKSVPSPDPSVDGYRNALQRIRSTSASGVESGVRTQLFDSFLKCTHGDLLQFAPLHLMALEKDPLFYGHLATWYFHNGSVRDHQELFVIHLLISPIPAHREHGEILMEKLRVYQVARIVRYAKAILSFPTRALRTAVTSYLRRREAHPAWFEEAVIRDKKSMKYLYATQHVKPSPAAEILLFSENPPPGSRAAATRLLPRLAQQPDRQAEIILQHRIPYTTALGAVLHFTPSVLYALAAVMTPPQVINNLKFLEKRGALANDQTRAVIDEKLKAAVQEGRVSDLKARVAMSHIKPDAQMARDLIDLTTRRLQNRGRLRRPTALLVDKSGSMQQCIEVGKLLACLCSTVADSDLYVYAFDADAFRIQASASTFAAWETAFAPVRADGCTSIGAPLRSLMPYRVEQVVVITDGEENTAPFFSAALETYELKHGRTCDVFILRVGASPTSSLQTSLQHREVTVIPFAGDYYSLPNVIPMLCGGTRFDTVQEIMQVPLFTSRDRQTLPPGFDEQTLEIL